LPRIGEPWRATIGCRGRLCGCRRQDSELRLYPLVQGDDSSDLNPVLLDSAGKGCVVVDAVVFQG